LGLYPLGSNSVGRPTAYFLGTTTAPSLTARIGSIRGELAHTHGRCPTPLTSWWSLSRGPIAALPSLRAGTRGTPLHITVQRRPEHGLQPPLGCISVFRILRHTQVHGAGAEPEGPGVGQGSEHSQSPVPEAWGFDPSPKATPLTHFVTCTGTRKRGAFRTRTGAPHGRAGSKGRRHPLPVPSPVQTCGTL
jgi:hypothetical protein